MDIQHLIDRLEDLVDEGRHIPMGKYTIVDEEKVLGIIDQMRISIPEQIESASRVVNQRDKLMAQANEEAGRILDYARQKQDELVNRDSIVVGARHQADNIIAQAHTNAERVRDEADAYVVSVLRDLESHLLRTLTVVRNGIAKVQQDQQIRNHQQPQAPASDQQPATMPIPQREEVLIDADEGEQS